MVTLEPAAKLFLSYHLSPYSLHVISIQYPSSHCYLYECKLKWLLVATQIIKGQSTLTSVTTLSPVEISCAWPVYCVQSES